ncbi:MAG: hypothetical protein R3321_14870 [Nitrososphaeraceae archaeon]|nr:hypothetical protein [Nitrososphaeraceae archaeon]
MRAFHKCANGIAEKLEFGINLTNLTDHIGVHMQDFDVHQYFLNKKIPDQYNKILRRFSNCAMDTFVLIVVSTLIASSLLEA